MSKNQDEGKKSISREVLLVSGVVIMALAAITVYAVVVSLYMHKELIRNMSYCLSEVVNGNAYQK